jgi:hypothetical protein
MQAGSPDHIDQGIEAKQFDLAAHEIGDTRLGNTKQLGGLRLAQPVPRSLSQECIATMGRFASRGISDIVRQIGIDETDLCREPNLRNE